MKPQTKKATGLAAAVFALVTAGGLDYLPPEVTGALGTFIQRNPLTTGAVIGVIACVAVIVNFKADAALREHVNHLSARIADIEVGEDTTELDDDDVNDAPNDPNA